MKTGILYFNLGTPQSPTPRDVGVYLREFLMDPLVIDIPYLFRALLVYGIIAPFRSRKSAHAYQQIWTSEGSPLLINSQKFVSKLQAELGADIPVALGMRYGRPSLREALVELIEKGVTDLRVLPAYPQYAKSSTETGFVKIREEWKALLTKGAVRQGDVQVRMVKSYEDHPAFIQAIAQQVKEAAKDFHPDHYLLSYHGLPLSHLQKANAECVGGDCSLRLSSSNQDCYRRQSFQTSSALAKELQLRTGQYSVGFQSRLSGRWIEPYSDTFYEELPKKGVRRLLVACPSFTADCLETLEEVGMRGREQFIASGGEDLKLVPCVNDSKIWVAGVKAMMANTQLWEPL
jgi:ferrochelatase